MDISTYLDSECTAASLAAKLNIAASLISQWKNGIRPIPDERCPEIEFATSGAVTCEELRPDVTWHRVPDANWPNPAGRPLVDHFSKKAA